MRIKRTAAFGAALLLSSAALAGCASGSGGGDADAVSIYVFGYDDGMDAWVADTTAAFDALELGYSIDITVIPPNELQQTLTTRMQGGNPPDISSAPTAWVPAFSGGLRDLSTIMSSELADGFEPVVAEQATFDDRLVVAPYGTSTRAMYVNEDLLAAAGVDEAPATWEELIEVAPAIKDASGLDAGIGIQGVGNETFAAWFPYVYWSFGGDFGTGETIEIEENACVAGLEVLNDLVQSGGAQANPTSSDLVDIQDQLASGQVAMTMTGPWFLGAVAELPVTIAPIPAGTTQSTLAVADGWISFEGSAASEEQIGAVLDFLLSEEIEVPFLKDRGFLPSLTRDFADPHYQSEQLKPFVDALSTAKFVPLSEQWASLVVTGESAMQSMYLGDATPAEVCGTLIDSLS